MTWTTFFRIASCLVISILLGSVGHAQQTMTFSNTASFSIPQEGPASLYPSTINVSGFTGSGIITDFTVRIYGFSHIFPQDVEAMVAGPIAGQKTLLFNGAGSGNTITNVDLAFNDGAAAQLPLTGTIISGEYQPGLNRFSGDSLVFSAPAPAGPYSTTFGSMGTPVGNVPFLGAINPNGTYSLFIEDITGGDAGSISGGWDITITYAPVPEPTSILFGAAGFGMVGAMIRRRWNMNRA